MKNKMAVALKAARDRHEAAKAALEKVTAVVGAKPLPHIDTSAVDQARLHLEDCLARKALDEATYADVVQARQSLEKAEADLAEIRERHSAEHAAAQLESSGLGRRLHQAKDEAAAAEQALEEAEIAWLQEELRLADEAYASFALEARDNYLRVMACWQILYRRNVKVANSTEISQEISLPSIGPKSCELATNPQDGRRGISAYIFHGKRNFGGQEYLDSMSAELEAAATGMRGKVERMVKAVAGTVSETVSETVSRLSGK